MNSLGIIAVRYNITGNPESGIALLRLRNFKYHEGKVLIPLLPYLVMSKIEVINQTDLFTLIPTSEELTYNLGAQVRSVKNKFLRIDEQDTESDSLGNLPEF